MKLDILALVAHPDDAEAFCGATLALHQRRGGKVGVVDLTDGEKGTRGNAELRKEEASKASELLGLSVRRHLSFPDGFVEDSRENRIEIIRVLRAYRPDIVITNAHTDRHPDHELTSRLVYRACFLSGLPKIETHWQQKPQEAWRPLHLYGTVQSYYVEPDFIVDVSETWDVKVKAIKAYASQFFHPAQPQEPKTLIANSAYLEMLEARGREFGFRIGAQHGEGFTVFRVPGVRTLTDLL